MSHDIFVSVDGGGTKSKIRIESAAGHVLGQTSSGPANIRISVAETWQSINAGLAEILTPLGIGLNNPFYHFHAGLGLAGTEVQSAVDDFLAQPHLFKTIHLKSDAHIACLGAHNGAAGAIISVGTGIVGYQIDQGVVTKVGGWGFPHDDDGSGAWLGMEAVRLTCQWLDHRSEKSPLAEDIFNYFNRDVTYFTHWINTARATHFARLAPLVINHSQQEEAAAVRLMKKAAHAIDRIAYALIKQQKNPATPLPLCLMGGIAPFLEPWLGADLQALLTPRQQDAITGAMTMIRSLQRETHVCLSSP